MKNEDSGTGINMNDILCYMNLHGTRVMGQNVISYDTTHCNVY